MADLKISQLGSIVTVVPATDVLPVVQGGTTYKVTPNQLLGAGGTATLASATITGAATVGTTLGVTGVSTFAAGTALLPALTTTGDTNTGIYYPAADTFAVTTGGVERYRVDSTGLGIGAVATSKLTVNGEISVTDNFALRLGSNQAGGATLLYNGSGNLDITPRSGFHTKLVDGNLIIGTSGKGIDFSATANSSGTMTSELLADYEEGTFTPSIIGTTSAGTATYAIQIGVYTKIGRTVQFQLDVSYSAGTGTGNLRVSGLPFTNGGYLYPVTVYPLNIGMTALYYAAGILGNGVSFIDMEQLPTGGGGDLNIPYDAAGRIIITGTYSV